MELDPEVKDASPEEPWEDVLDIRRVDIQQLRAAEEVTVSLQGEAAEAGAGGTGTTRQVSADIHSTANPFIPRSPLKQNH